MNRKTLLIVLGAVLVLKFVMAVLVPLTPDESLHWMQGRHLAWGFRDHPPVTAFLSFVSRSLFGVSTVSARLFAILSTTLCSLIAYGILKEAGCSEKTACRGAVMLQLMPMFTFGMLMVPVFPFTALVFATEYFLFRAVRRDRPADHLLWGFFLGVSVLSYYIVITAALAAGVYCALDQKGRQVLSSPRFWAGAALATLIAAPNIWWNITLGTDSAVWFQMFSRSPYAFSIMHFISFAVVCIIITGPAIVLAAIRTPSAIRDSTSRLFALAFGIPMVGFLLLALFREAGAHWAVVAFLNVPIIIALRGEARPHSRWWLRIQAVYLVLVIAVAAVGFVIGPKECAERFDPEGKITGRRRVTSYFESESTARTVHKWKETLAQKGQHVSLVTDKWGTAGVMSFYTPGHPYYFVHPNPDRHGQDYALWNTNYPPTEDILFVRSGYPSHRRELAKAWDSTELLLKVGNDVRPSYALYLCKGFDPAR